MINKKIFMIFNILLFAYYALNSMNQNGWFNVQDCMKQVKLTQSEWASGFFWAKPYALSGLFDNQYSLVDELATPKSVSCNELVKITEAIELDRYPERAPQLVTKLNVPFFKWQDWSRQWQHSKTFRNQLTRQFIQGIAFDSKPALPTEVVKQILDYCFYVQDEQGQNLPMPNVPKKILPRKIIIYPQNLVNAESLLSYKIEPKAEIKEVRTKSGYAQKDLEDYHNNSNIKHEIQFDYRKPISIKHDTTWKRCITGNYFGKEIVIKDSNLKKMLSLLYFIRTGKTEKQNVYS